MSPNSSSSSSSPAPEWDAWIQQGLQSIRGRKLERVLRPLIPTGSPVEVGVVWVERPALYNSGQTIAAASCGCTSPLNEYLAPPRYSPNPPPLPAAQAYIHKDELAAWLAEQPSTDSCDGMMAPLTLQFITQQQQQQQQHCGHHHQQQHSQQQQQAEPSSSSSAAGVSCGGVDASSSMRRLVLFSLNDYLGLSSHPHVRAAAAAAAQQVRCGVLLGRVWMCAIQRTRPSAIG